jgi:hypothetical protein
MAAGLPDLQADRTPLLAVLSANSEFICDLSIALLGERKAKHPGAIDRCLTGNNMKMFPFSARISFSTLEKSTVT